MTDLLDARRDRLDAYLADNDLAAVWFAQPNSFAWLTGGDNVVSRGGSVGVAAAGYDGDSFRAVTNNIEAQRLLDEELPDAFSVETFQWYESDLAEALESRSPNPAAADFDVPGFEAVDASAVRQPLTGGDVDLYRALGHEAAAAMESVARELEPEDTEHEVAAALRIGLESRDIRAPVSLVGGSERAPRYRHYTPKHVELGDYALLSVTAERDGLFASLTRTVAFDEPDWLAERTEKAMTVSSTALAATQAVAREGGTAGDVFGHVQDAYAAVDYPDEWQLHHQGGAAGYAGREWKATPTSEATVYAPMAYAWNPTVQGAKAEDTVLVTDEGFEVLTTTGNWETRAVDAEGFDVSVPQHEILRVD